ncbi:unnamed protein product [Chondrus crispus]|uniref:Methyltransferase type 11 domain-containing protein n=1 Tax=Chondrus crispus TaxID=2769 RepID=R7QPL0_CHOCR|nr:unnamed protein product [Chondrus crispus]CDF39718.1 unnamed protein product [Chondrus crispus]|eukprot:XP_005710012.1 unnamed protein product [Chondrus crispus]
MPLTITFTFVAAPPLLPPFRSRRPTPASRTLLRASGQPSQQHSTSRRALLHLASISVLSTILPAPSSPATRCLPEGAAVTALTDVAWPPSMPFAASDFARFDERPDDVFYSFPRLVRHIDGPAVAALGSYYRSLLPMASDVLDVCASVEAYLPGQWPGRRVVAGVGMNEVEMQQNPALNEFAVRDLNVNPKLPYPDESFDLVMCNVSIDYLTKPVQVVQEMRRVLRKGGKVAISFSDRVFGTKAVSAWMSGGDQDHVYIVGAYLHYARGLAEPKVLDLTPRKGGKCTSDPLYVVQATKL